jgi:hypothetical protein
MAKLTVNECAGDYNEVIKLTADKIKAIGNGGQLVIATLPAGSAVDLVGVVNSVDIAGSSSLQIDIGTTSGTPTEFISGWDVDAATVGLPVFNTGTSFVQSAGTTTIKGGSLPVKAVSADTPVYLKVTDAAVASITAGEIVVGSALLI